jgi:hypothetical protein
MNLFPTTTLFWLRQNFEVFIKKFKVLQNSIIYIIKNSKKYLNSKIEDLNIRNGDLNLRKRYLNTFKKK